MLSREVTVKCPDGSIITFADVLEYAYFNRVMKMSFKELEQTLFERHLKQMYADLDAIEKNNPSNS